MNRRRFRYLAVGFAFAWLYVEQVEPRLTFGPGTSGLFFGAGLWLFVQVIAVPALGIASGAAAAPGLLSANFGVAAAGASLLAHLAYGGVLTVPLSRPYLPVTAL